MEIAIILKDKEIIISSTVLSLLIIAVFLIGFALIVNYKVKRQSRRATRGLVT